MSIIEALVSEAVSRTLQDKHRNISVLFFYALQSPQCEDVLIAIKEYAKKDLYSDLVFIKIEALKFPELLELYKVEIVPTLIFIQENKIKDRLDGYNLIQLKQKLKYWALTIPDKINSEYHYAPNNQSLDEKLKDLITQSPYMLFMKGSPENPQCGFSKQIIEILKNHHVSFGHFDILQDQEVREGLKKYSNWPTYPQLYKNGELIGGLDIIRELEANGELDELFNTIVTNGNEEIKPLEDRLKELINQAPVMVFMKGNPQAPMCKFSRALIPMLNETKIPYETFDILEDEEVRQGLKEYSKWPTYPQIYVKGELIGGIDIIQELKESGDLKSTLNPET